MKIIMPMHLLKNYSISDDGTRFCTENMVFVGMPNLDDIDKELSLIYASRMEKSKKYIWACLEDLNEQCTFVCECVKDKNGKVDEENISLCERMCYGPSCGNNKKIRLVPKWYDGCLLL